MSDYREQLLFERYPDEIADKLLVILHIGDDYQYMDEELIEILTSRLAEYLTIDEC